MSMVCPQCQRGFDQRLSCPDCGVRLLFQLAAAKSSSPATSAFADDDNWQQTPWGRMLAGLLLAQGLGYGFQQMMTAGFLASGDATVWTTLWGIVLLHLAQGLSLIIGGAICGAGQQKGTTYGSLIGLVNGIIFLMVQRHTGDLLTEIAVYCQPILHLAFGALGGLIGTAIWRPTLNFAVDETKDTPRPRPKLGSSFRMLDGPVHLTRVLMGIAIVVLGVMWSNVILEFALRASDGKLALRSHLQAQLVSWEIAGLAILFGSGLAGACTYNGMKQGLCVGLGASMVFAGMQLGNPNSLLEKTLMMMLSIFFLSLAGGWFGGQLLPPLVVRRRRSILTG